MSWRRHRYRGALALWTLLMLLSGLLRGGPAFATTPPLTQGDDSAIVLTANEPSDGEQNEPGTPSDDEGAAPDSDESEESGTESEQSDTEEPAAESDEDGSDELIKAASVWIELTVTPSTIPAGEAQTVTLSGFAEMPADLVVTLFGYTSFGAQDELDLTTSVGSENGQITALVSVPPLRPGAYDLVAYWEGGTGGVQVLVGTPNVRIQAAPGFELESYMEIKLTAIGGENDGLYERHWGTNGLIQLWLPPGTYRINEFHASLAEWPIDRVFSVTDGQSHEVNVNIVAPPVALVPGTIAPDTNGSVVMEAVGFQQKPSPMVDVWIEDPSSGWSILNLHDLEVVRDDETETWKVRFEWTPDSNLTPGETYRVVFRDNWTILAEGALTVEAAPSLQLTLTPTEVTYGQGETIQFRVTGFDEEPTDPVVLILDPTDWPLCCAVSNKAVAFVGGDWELSFDVTVSELGLGRHAVSLLWGDGAMAEISFNVVEQPPIQQVAVRLQPNWIAADATGSEIVEAHGFATDPSHLAVRLYQNVADISHYLDHESVSAYQDPETSKWWLEVAILPGLAPGKYDIVFVGPGLDGHAYLYVGQPNVTFQVTDGSGTSLSGARVRVETENGHQDLYTDAWGEAPAQLTPGATYRIASVVYQGMFHSVNQPFTVPQAGGAPLTIPIVLMPPPVSVSIMPSGFSSNYPEPINLRAIFPVSMLDEPLDPTVTLYLDDTAVADAVVQGSIATGQEDGFWYVEFQVRTGLRVGEYMVMIDYTVDGEGARRAEGDFQITQAFETHRIQVQPNWVPVNYTGDEIMVAHGFTRDPAQAEVHLWSLSSNENFAEKVTVVTSDYHAETGWGWVQFSLAPGLAPGKYVLQFQADMYFYFYNYVFVGKPNVIFITEDADGAPVGHVSLTLEEVGGEQALQFVGVGDEGQAEHRLTPGTTYRVIQGAAYPNTVWPLNIRFTVPAEGEPPLMVKVPLVPQEHNVEATVRDEAGAPIPNATLVIEAADGSSTYARTDDQGVFRLKLEPGQYYLTDILYSRNVTTRIPFTVTADTVFSGTLQVPGANVILTLLSGENPLANTWLEVRGLNSTGPAISEPTDAAGQIRLRLEPGTYQVSLSLLGHAIPLNPTTFVVTEDAEPLQLTMALDAHEVAITLVEEGVTLSNYWVKIVPSQGSAQIWSTNSDTLTAYLQNGTYQIVEIGQGARVVKVALTLTVDSPVQKQFELSTANVVLQVVDGENQPVPHAVLQIRPLAPAADGPYRTEWVTSDENGRIRLQLDAGVAYVIVGGTASDHALPMYWIFTAPDVDDPALHMTVSLAPNVTIELLDEEEHPLAHTWVWITANGNAPAMYVRTDEGGNLALGLMPDTYRIAEFGNATRHAKTDIAFTVADGFEGTLRLPQPNVVIRLTGADAANATLRILPANASPDDWSATVWAEADAAGVARVTLQAETAYVLVDARSGHIYNLLQLPFTTPAADQPALTLTVSVEANLDVILLDESGDPMPMTSASFESEAQTYYGAVSDEEGRLRLSLLPGTYTMTEVISLRRAQRVSVPFVVDAEQGYVGTLQLPAPTLEIQVVDANGPVAFASVFVHAVGESGGFTGEIAWEVTDSNGTARYSLRPGTYMVLEIDRISRTVVTSHRVTIVEGQTTRLTISLRPNLEVTLLDPEGNAMADAWVTIKPDNGEGQPQAAWEGALRVKTDGEGRFSLTVAPGLYHIVEVAAGDRLITMPLLFSVEPQGFTGELRLLQSNVKVSVRDESGNLAAGAWVRFLPAYAPLDAWDLSTWVQTDAQGSATALLSPSAPYRLADVNVDERSVRVNLPFNTPALGQPAIELNVALVPNVKATLERNDGTPIANAWVVVRPDDGSGQPSASQAFLARTDATGQFQMTLADDRYFVVQVGTEQGLITTSAMFVVDDGAFNGIVTLPKPSVTVTLAHPDDSPAAYAWVAVHPADADLFDFSQAIWFQADQHGEVAITLEPGEYVIYHVDTLAGWYVVQPQALTVGDDPVALPIKLEE